MGLTQAIFSIAAVLSLLAAVMAFLIAYKEYAAHYPDKRTALKPALETAFFTLMVFLALGFLLGIVLPLCFS